MIRYEPLLLDEIETETREGKRFYLTKEGAFPSVTTVLSHGADNSSLDAWKKRVGAKEADRVSNVAKRRGTAVHSLLEDYVLGKPMSPTAMPSNISTYLQIKKQIDRHMTVCHGIEVPLYSKVIRVAGRCDAIGVWDDELAIIDYKTSKNEKKKEHIESYFTQTSLYAYMLNEMMGLNVTKVAIIIGCDSAPEAQVFVERTNGYIEKALDLVNSYYESQASYNQTST